MGKLGLVLGIFMLLSCKVDPKVERSFKSADSTRFSIVLQGEDQARKLLSDSILSCRECSVGIVSKAGKTAIALTTDKEFSDGLIDLKKLFGHTIDFRAARFAELELFIPSESWITALKFNYEDEKGNFGGCQEITNNFFGHYDQWIKVRIDLREALVDCHNWVGEESPIPNTARLSLNPYNAHQADSSSIYIHSIQVGDLPVDNGGYVDALAPKPDTIGRPFKMDFEDGPLFRSILAYRGFESSGQALAKGKYGNETMALRIENNNNVKRKYSCFLPMFEKVTGKTVDFSKVKKIYFDYYLTKNSDPFPDATLFLTGKHWSQILKDDHALKNLKRGDWHTAEIYMDSLQLQLVKGDRNPIREIYELRIDLNYRPGHKNVEMWLDNFGWE